MMDTGRILVLFGVLLALIGGLVWLAGRYGFRGLPGDIHYESGTTRFYFPIVTCLVISALLTGLMWLWNYFGRR